MISDIKYLWVIRFIKQVVDKADSYLFLENITNNMLNTKIWKLRTEIKPTSLYTNQSFCFSKHDVFIEYYLKKIKISPF